MILYDKLVKKYTLIELRSLLGESCANRINSSLLNVSIEKISGNIPFDSIGYSYEDFLEDFGEKYINHVEKKMIFNIFKYGISPSALIKEFNLESTIYYYFKNGFIYSGKARDVHLLFDILEIEVDISDFKLESYDNHIELFGDKDLLLKFQQRYSLPYEVLWEPYLEKWHLAFDGCLANYIKLKYKKNRKKAGNSK